MEVTTCQLPLPLLENLLCYIEVEECQLSPHSCKNTKILINILHNNDDMRF